MLKDAIFILAVGVVALTFAMALKVLVWLGQASVFVGFLFFCYWFTRRDEFEREAIRGRVTNTFKVFGALLKKKL